MGGRGTETDGGQAVGGSQDAGKLHNQQRRREWQKSIEGQTELTPKWTQRMEDRWAHLYQSRHKKGHRTNIYLTDSYEEVTMDFVKDHKESYNTKERFKDKARKECLWDMFTNSHNLSVKVSKVKSQRTCYAKISQSKSGLPPKEMKERQNWIQDKLNFLETHIIRKELSKSLGLKFPARGASASSASAHGISRSSTDTDSMEISLWSDQECSLPAVSQRSSVNKQIKDQFA